MRFVVIHSWGHLSCVMFQSVPLLYITNTVVNILNSNTNTVVNIPIYFQRSLILSPDKIHLCVFYFQDGNITCASHQCPTLRCQNIVQDPQECCPRCAANSSTLARQSSSPSSRHRPHSPRQRGRKPFKKGTRSGGGGRRMLNSG